MTAPETSRYYTPKLGLLAPSIDDELDACRPNWERLDSAYAGALWVNPGVTPDQNQLFDGAIIAEYTTGIVWRAQKNASGVYEKRYIKYPLSINLYQATQAFPNTGVAGWGAWGYGAADTTWCVNSSASDLVNNRLVIPVTGIWVGADMIRWSGSNVGYRAHTIVINDLTGGTAAYDWDEDTWVPGGDGDVSTRVPINRKLNKGDTVVASVWNNAGVAVNTFHRIHLALERALG